MTPLNLAMLKGARQLGPIQWGKIAPRSQYAIDHVGNSFHMDDGIDGLYQFFGEVILACQRGNAG